MGFDWGMFWQATSAIATMAAVVVALWQTTYNNKKRLQIRVRESVILTGKDSSEPYIEIEIANTGNRKVIITRYGISLNENYFIVAVPNDDNMINTESPVMLDVEEYKIIRWKKSEFIQILRERCTTSNNMRVTIFVQDSSGKMYIKKTPKSRLQYLDETTIK